MKTDELEFDSIILPDLIKIFTKIDREVNRYRKEAKRKKKSEPKINVLIESSNICNIERNKKVLIEDENYSYWDILVSDQNNVLPEKTKDGLILKLREMVNWKRYR